MVDIVEGDRGGEICSLLNVPIKAPDGKIIGSLSVDYRMPRTLAFSAEEKEAFELFSRQLGSLGYKPERSPDAEK